MIFVDGPDGVGKTGYSKHIARNLGLPRLEMRPVDDFRCIDSKSEVFNAVLADLSDQDVDVVVDRGTVSSIVYARIYDRPKPEYAWSALDTIQPTIVYLACDPEELAIRYDDELVTSDEIKEVAAEYEKVMERVDSTTSATVKRIDTSAGVPSKITDIEFAYNLGEDAV